MQWTVLIPAKSLPEAKSRLAGASAHADDHARLVQAIREDTIQAAATAPNVARIVLIVDRAAPEGQQATEQVLVQSAPGLNPALREGAAYAAALWPQDGVAALVGDLPALRPAELADALAAAVAHPRAYVPDAANTGTTLLTALPGIDLRPQFGPDSAVHHGGSAPALDAGPGLRHDVDTYADLRAAAQHGLGAHTAAALPAEMAANPA